MRYLVILLLFSLVFVSGCTFLEPSSTSVEPLSISLESDLKNVRSDDVTYLYLVLDNLDEKERYDIETKIMNTGIFEIVESPEDTELGGLQKKTLEWRLRSPQVSSETTSRVSVEAKISKEFEFSLPIKFGEPSYLREKEQGGNPVPKDPKNYQFSDNLVSVNVELNKNPPFDEGNAYANIKISPKIDGLLSLDDVISDGDCKVDRFNTISCTFPSGGVNQIKEKKFRVNIRYYVKVVKSMNFVVLPKNV